jgi:hypothetical protein
MGTEVAVVELAIQETMETMAKRLTEMAEAERHHLQTL